MKSLTNAVVERLLSLRELLGRTRPVLAGCKPTTDTPPASPDTGTDCEAGPAEHFVPPSAHTKIATPQDIFFCFRLLLDRCPTPEEWPGHSTRAGEDLGNVVAGFVTSHEFTARGLGDKVYYDKVELVRLPGFSLFASIEDLAVGQHILNTNSYDPGIGIVLNRHVKPGMTIVDIGANIGYFTMLMAAAVTSTGRVIAVEPNPDNTRLLEASRRVNGFDWVTVFQVAAGRGTGLLALNVSYSNGMTVELPEDSSAVLASRMVPCFALDMILPQDRHIDLLKIDIEGAELNALIGLADTIDRDRPIIVSEFSPGTLPGISHCTGPEYLQYLLNRGYRIGVIGRKDGSEAMVGSDVDAIMRAYARSGIDHIDIIAVAG
jgi:FkbM family methyltransferase